ncbi:ras-associating and dilute domain-containing protein isoform 1 [Cricetulus griseus]|uniref:Ras-associating and dilute domain-containing protein n=1 Tax=Cricetulus griseus TaxID=10029 RepID=A0A061I948_CRIGR|nr:ras-associating and dilute domain-containing protein isoform 1 [Cricetulus griseus]
MTGINAQARRLQRVRAKGTPALTSEAAQSSPPTRLRRSVSETSLSPATILPDAVQSPEESTSDSMRYSLYQCPHLLLLQGYSQQHDSLVYVLSRERHTVGQRTPSSKPSISLSAPDILPLHCTIRRHQSAEGGQAGTKMRVMGLQEKTKELAEKQAQLQEPISWASFPMADLVPDLQHILFWMSNSIELLYFIQQKCPLYMQSMEEELDVTGSKESLFSCTLTASEEAMAALEEVVLYAFQQCVYYLSKTERRESWHSGPALPEELRRVVSVFQATSDLLQQLQVHPEVASQMLAYLFFFSGTLLLNQVLDKGPSLSCFHWPRGVQACARLQQFLEWARSTGLGAPAERFFRKLSCTLHLLATPSAQLVQMSWVTLRATFPALNPAQLHRLLTQYQLASAMGPMSAWEPGAQDSPEAFQSEDILESYENPPPIVLPSQGFQVDLEADCLEDSIYQHLLYIRHFLWGLRGQASPDSGPIQPEGIEGLYHTIPEGHPEGHGCPLANRDPGRGAVETAPAHPLPVTGAPWTQGPLGRQPARGDRRGSQAGSLHTDSSCLLTPPSTPLGQEPGGPTWPEPSSLCGKALLEGQRNGPGGPPGVALEGDTVQAAAEPPAEASSPSSSAEDFCYVFMVELERGPSGLGMGLIDGMHTPLGAPGLYIQTLLPGSPAASDGRLSLGDRILEVNGSSLMGVSYMRAVDLIRHGGKKMRFLVAKSDVETAKKIRFRKPPS